MSTTFEEAKLCPKCGKPGDDRKQTRSKDSHGKPVTVHLIYCTTELCRWYNTCWSVQVNADGSIPTAYSSAFQQKMFPKVSQETETRIQEAMDAQLRAETQPGGGEVRNPNG